MQKISSFYVDKVEELDAIFEARDGQWSQDDLAKYISEMQALKKYATLNYIAVYKAVKKRNRQLQERFPGTPIKLKDAEMLLREQRFFTSNRLATLFTRAQLLQASSTFTHTRRSALQEEYSCPICLGVLHNPVVLTCAHRFCWGCVVTDCATRKAPTSPASPSSGKQAVEEEEGGEAGTSSASSGGKQTAPVPAGQQLSDQLLRYASSTFESLQPYECACCRRVQFLDLNNLQVDQHLAEFVLKLDSTELANNVSSITSAGASRVASTALPSLEVEMPDAPSALAEPDSSDVDVPPKAVLRAEAVPFVPKLAPCEAPPPADAATRKPAGYILGSQADNHPAGSAPQVTAAQAASVIAPVMPPDPASPEHLLPPRAPEDAHKMTVLLDMDGTLLSSYSAVRQPRLPPGLNTFVTGKGGKLNPGGVLVVERPGLHKFLSDLSSFAEVVLFTAGIPDYANPIINHLDPESKIFRSRLFREATTKSRHYSCVKDMSCLGRDLSRTVLVDDTPLAFLNQPNNGIPVFAFRSDPDDRFLCEAVLPLLQSLSQEEDVRPVIAKRFGMVKWFQGNGFDSPEGISASTPGVQPALRPSVDKKAVSETLLLMDFDKTVTLADAGEAVVGTLAPELLPLLDGLEMPASFVAVTNDILSEMQRRGISRDTMVATLRDLGQRLIPVESQRLMRLAARRNTDVRILSDCNSVFISHMLAGVGVRPLVKEIITNGATFERIGAAKAGEPDSKEGEGEAPLAGKQQWGMAHSNPGTSHRLVITPRHGQEAGSGHGCPLCPHNLCKGQELDHLRQELGYKRVIYCGDGANDICPTLRLLEGDVVCVRRGHSLEYLVRERREAIKARVLFWEDHQELLSLVHNLLQ